MLNIDLPYDPAVSFLGINPRELKTFVHMKIYKRVFIVALFIKAKKWKPECLSAIEQINKCGVSIHWNIT